MLKNFVIIKHLNDNGKYLFRVPNGISLEAGDKVVCDTCKGNDQIGVCLCDSFLADPETMYTLFATKESNMKWITGKVEIEKFSEAREEEEYKEKFEEEET